jgi:hypothetical protein
MRFAAQQRLDPFPMDIRAPFRAEPGVDEVVNVLPAPVAIFKT